MFGEKSFVDMVPAFDVGTASYRDIEKTLRGDQRHTVTCYECKKEFNKFLPGGPNWQYRDRIKGKTRYFCTWTCLSRNRKKRGLKNV